MMARKPQNRSAGGNSADPLDAEDAALWDKVAKSAEPQMRGRNRARLNETGSSRPAAKPSKPPASRSAKSARPASPPGSISLPAASAPPPPLGQYDRREAKGLSSGRIEIDARIDLHGMRQREAHGALKSFIARARGRGHRHVLVITGKGAPQGMNGPQNYYEEHSRPPGVLRRNVPLWLDEPELRQWIVGYRAAAQRHGGEGALYVRLRRWK